MKRAPIAIIGVGNYLMGDEGVGIHAIEKLRGLAWPDRIEIIDGGTPGLALLHLIEGRELAIIIDCADFGGAPGEVAIFNPDNLRRDKRTEAGLHATDLLSALELAKRTGNDPKKVLIVGIQPKTISMGTTLSDDVKAALKDLPDLIRSAQTTPPAALSSAQHPTSGVSA